MRYSQILGLSKHDKLWFKNILLEYFRRFPLFDNNKRTFLNCLMVQVPVPVVAKTYSLNIPNTSNTVSIVRTLPLEHELKCEYFFENNMFSKIANLFSNNYVAETKAKTNIPIVLIDNWTSKAPYIELLSILKYHKNIKFILTTNTKMIKLNADIISKIKKFVKIDNCRALHPCYCKNHEFINMRYLKYLNREQRTRYIDNYVKKTFSNKKVIISSIGYNLTDLYDTCMGNYETLYIDELYENVHILGARPQHIGKTLVEEEYGELQIQTHIVDESSIDKKNTFVVLIDPMSEHFDYLNISSNNILEKLRQFGKKSIVISEKDDGHVLNIYEKQLLLEKICPYAHVGSMMYIFNSSYFSCFIDDFIESSNTHCKHLKPCVAFLDDELRNLYKGKYPIVKLDVEIRKYNHANNGYNDNFLLDYNYPMVENKVCNIEEYIKNVAEIDKSVQDVITGYISGKVSCKK